MSKHQPHPGPTSLLPGIDFSHEAYRGFDIRRDMTGMFIERNGKRLQDVPAALSWKWARQIIDAAIAYGVVPK